MRRSSYPAAPEDHPWVREGVDGRAVTCVPLCGLRHLHTTNRNRRLGCNLMPPATRRRYTAWSVSDHQAPPCDGH